MPLKNTTDGCAACYLNDVQLPQSSLVQPFRESGKRTRTSEASPLRGNRLHLSPLSRSAGGAKEAALCAVKQQHQRQRPARRERVLIPRPLCLSFRVLLRRRMFHQKVIIRRYYLTPHKHTTQLAEAVLASFVRPLFFLILSKRNVRDY